MTPAMKIIRRIMLLPVEPAEKREQEMRETQSTIQRLHSEFKQVKEDTRKKSDILREAYDDLLGKL